ncbi:MAG: hypothetical protein R3F59_20335 [Myxococcota bacterium]
MRPSFFADNPVSYQAVTVLGGDGAFYGASGGGRVAYAASRDIAAVAVAALLHPRRTPGRRTRSRAPRP